MTTRAMAWTALAMLAVRIVWPVAYDRLWSPAAHARQTAVALIEAAQAGDVPYVQTMLSDDARITADDVYERFRGLSQVQIVELVDVYRPSGLNFVAVVMTRRRDGVPHGTFVRLRFDGERWVVVDVDTNLEIE